MDREYQEAGILVNTDGHVPIDEAAPCYKSSEEVINAVTGASLARIEYSLWPLASLKGTEEGRSRRAKRRSERKSERRSERTSSDHYSRGWQSSHLLPLADRAGSAPSEGLTRPPRHSESQESS